MDKALGCLFFGLIVVLAALFGYDRFATFRLAVNVVFGLVVLVVVVTFVNGVLELLRDSRRK